MMQQDGAGLREAGPADAARLASVLAEAFRDDPVMNWVFGGPRAIPALFRMVIRHVYLPHGRAFLIGGEGATLWAPSDIAPHVPRTAMLALMARAVLFDGTGVLKRVSALQEAMSQHKPEAAHLYLFAIGVRRGARGEGLGGQLLDPVLAECDARGEAVYLENSNPRNHRFYASRGFETQAIFHAKEGAPPMEAMWRAPH